MVGWGALVEVEAFVNCQKVLLDQIRGAVDWYLGGVVRGPMG